MKTMINKLLEFKNVHSNNTCNECGANTDDEYCQLCAPHMEEQ